MPMNDSCHEDQDAAHAVLRSLALKAIGLTGADIERLVREARQKARRQSRALAYSDLHGILASARTERSEALRWRMALHESGHAVAGLVLDLGSLASISIDSPTGGYAASEMPMDEPETEDFFARLLIVRLSGRAAEDVFLGSVAAGSAGTPTSDLARATELALAMEATLGFSKDAPLLYRQAEDPNALLAYHPLLAERVNVRLEEAYAEAHDLVGRNREGVNRPDFTGDRLV